MSEERPEGPIGIQVPAVWVGLEEEPVAFTNQFIGQVDDQCDAVLSFGQVLGPVLLGTPEQQRDQLQNIPFVQVRPVVRLSLSRPRIEELIGVLQQTLENQATCRTKREEIDS